MVVLGKESHYILGDSIARRVVVHLVIEASRRKLKVSKLIFDKYGEHIYNFHFANKTSQFLIKIGIYY